MIESERASEWCLCSRCTDSLQENGTNSMNSTLELIEMIWRVCIQGEKKNQSDFICLTYVQWERNSPAQLGSKTWMIALTNSVCTFAALQNLMNLYLGAKKNQRGTRLMLSNRLSCNKHGHILFVLGNKSTSNAVGIFISTVHML